MAASYCKTRVSAGEGVLAVTVHSDRAFARHSHEQYGIGMLDDGGHRSASGRGMVEAGPGDLIAVNPAEIHDGASVSGVPRRWRMLYFDQDVIRDAVSGLSDDTCEFTAPVWRDPSMRPVFDALFRVCARSVADSVERLLREECLLRMLMRLAGNRRRATGHGVSAGIARAKDAIDADPARGFSMTELAGLSGVERFGLIRMFARATGLTPHAYLVQRRVDLARDLIGQGRDLADVALSAGFSDQSHLTRAFAARFGYTPGVFASAFR